MVLAPLEHSLRSCCSIRYASFHPSSLRSIPWTPQHPMLFHSILCIPSVLPKNSFTYNVKIGTFRNPKFAFLIKVLITVVIVPTSLLRYNVIPLHSYTGIPLYRCTIIPLLPLKNVKSPLMPLAFVLGAFVFHRIQVYLNGIRRASETKLGCLFRDCVYFVIQSCTL